MAIKAERKAKKEIERPSLVAFRVRGLHKAVDMEMKFNDAYNIFLADNGSGKTTALFMLQSLLRGNMTNLLRLQFENIVLEFADGECVEIEAKDLVPRRARLSGRSFFDRYKIPPAELNHLMRLTSHSPLVQVREDPIFRRLMRISGVPSVHLYEQLVRYMSTSQDDLFATKSNQSSIDKQAEIREKIQKHFQHSVIYLPTYRRIERNLQTVAAENSSLEDEYEDLHFGMKDVQARIEALGENIRKHAASSYGQTSGQILSQLVGNPAISDEIVDTVSEDETVKLVLGRIRGYISDEVRDRILNMVKDGSIKNNSYLAVFVYELIQAYRQVKDQDIALRNFADACNTYLIDKSLDYDNLTASLSLVNKRTGQKLDLEVLSSGEKQILGILAEVYLGSEASYAVIFDEPELSLSVEWQKKILVDITTNSKCKFLVAATHSPFVFDNYLQANVRALTVRPYQP